MEHRIDLHIQLCWYLILSYKWPHILYVLGRFSLAAITLKRSIHDLEILNSIRNSRQPNQTWRFIRMGLSYVIGTKNNADTTHCSRSLFHLATIQTELNSHP